MTGLNRVRRRIDLTKLFPSCFSIIVYLEIRVPDDKIIYNLWIDTSYSKGSLLG
jgi:hypothetical protein